jgi:peptide/nickel transport system substrate-binding protein
LGINVFDEPDGKGNPLLKDKNIRQAIEYAMNKQKAAEMLYDNAGDVGTTLINPGDKYHYEPAGEELRDFSPDKANKLLDEAGYLDKDGDGIRESADGKPLKFDLISIADNTDEVKYGQMIKSDCLDVGVDINCVTMDSGAMSDKIAAYDYDMFIWGWGSDVDPTVILNVLTSAEIGGSNEPGWINEEYDTLVKEQAMTMDEEARIALVKEAQKICYDDAPYIILIYDNYTQAYRSDRFENIIQIPEGGTFFMNLTNVNYLKAKPL